ncbi:alpha/beta fold hydrolase [Lysinibacillus sp. BW-2-10]|uniref:alpha/beta fold hydrolase n=1 Tax=Lysinibacillus sp. BW-2-10 TaxID=2590030 RepID=UPI0021032AD0|nr:alpha/beta fold hydrolase [Lysinibacillus sp. BW-2-10]
MKKLTKVLPMSDGHQIFVRIYEPDAKPIGHFHILHGMAEHGDRYDAFAINMCEQGYFVTAHDHRGHGKTVELNGKLGYFADDNGFERVVDDVSELIQFFRYDFDETKTILFGHSMGSFIARRYIQTYNDIDKVILCGTGATTFLHQIGNALSRTLCLVQGKTVPSAIMSELSFGSFNKSFPNVKTAFDWLCSNEEEIEAYIKDPTCGFVPTNQFFVDLTDGLLSINRKNEMVNIRKDIPILLISGSEDPVGNKGAGVFKVANALKKVGLQDVVVYLFEGMRHEILKEKNKEHVFHVVSRWLENDRKRN